MLLSKTTYTPSITVDQLSQASSAESLFGINSIWKPEELCLHLRLKTASDSKLCLLLLLFQCMYTTWCTNVLFLLPRHFSLMQQWAYSSAGLVMWLCKSAHTSVSLSQWLNLPSSFLWGSFACVKVKTQYGSMSSYVMECWYLVIRAASLLFKDLFQHLSVINKW